jgi:hypothetical protein
MYYVVEINVVQNSFTTYRVTKTKPKEIYFGNKTFQIIATNKIKMLAVEAMIDACSENRDFMYIENNNYSYNELCDLVEKWKKEYARR